MPTSENNKLAEELAKSLESATTLMQDLLGDIKDNATSLALVKAKLESLSDSVEALSHIVRDGNGRGSMMTRLALVEKAVEDIDAHFDNLKKEVDESIKELKACIEEEKDAREATEKTEKEYKREKMLTRLKIAAVVAPGVIALAILLIKMLMGETPIP